MDVNGTMSQDLKLMRFFHYEKAIEEVFGKVKH